MCCSCVYLAQTLHIKGKCHLCYNTWLDLLIQDSFCFINLQSKIIQTPRMGVQGWSCQHGKSESLFCFQDKRILPFIETCVCVVGVEGMLWPSVCGLTARILSPWSKYFHFSFIWLVCFYSCSHKWQRTIRLTKGIMWFFQRELLDLSTIDVILISNYHCMMALPYITEHTGFTGTVYATEPTLQIGRCASSH